MTSPPLASITAADLAHCEGWIRLHSRSFYLASRLLPRRVRGPAWALYAFCRRSDDAVDEGTPGEAALGRLNALRRHLDLVYLDEHRVTTAPLADPIDRAYAAVATAHAIPRGLPDALLAGMEMDARGTRYETLDDLYLYCFRVASVVGLMMTLVMGARRPDALLRACELGVGMQLTNIARDVGEDARRSRVYLPDTLLALHGLRRDDVLDATEASWRLRAAVRQLLTLADEFYRSADRGVALLPPDSRLAIAAARHIYAAIGDDLERHRHDSITRRAHTSTARKVLLLGRALPLALRPAMTPHEGPADALLQRWISDVGLAVDDGTSSPVRLECSAPCRALSTRTPPSSRTSSRPSSRSDAAWRSSSSAAASRSASAPSSSRSRCLASPPSSPAASPWS